MIGLGIAIVGITVICLSLTKAAGMAERRMEELEKSSAGKGDGGIGGN